jgi:hypothetical protein
MSQRILPTERRLNGNIATPILFGTPVYHREKRSTPLVLHLSDRRFGKDQDTDKIHITVNAFQKEALSGREIGGAPARGGAANKMFTIGAGAHELEFMGREISPALRASEFYSHRATAYGALRHRGLKIGKREFMRLIHAPA